MIIDFVSAHVLKAAVLFFAVLIAPCVIFAAIWRLLSAFGLVC